MITRRIRWLFPLVIVLIALLLLPVARAQDGGLTETFDTPALPGWEYSPEVTVEQGVLRMPGPSGFAFYNDGAWTDMTLTLRARMVGEGELLLIYGSSGPETNYHALIGPDYLILYHVLNGTQTELGSLAPLPLSPGEWFTLGVTVSGGQHTLSLNGETVLAATVAQPLPAGSVGFMALGPEIVGEFDELTITPGGQTPPPAEDVPPAEPPDGPAPAASGQPAYLVGQAWHSTDGGQTWTPNWIVNLMDEAAARRIDTDVMANVMTMAPSDPQVVYMAFGNGACLQGSMDACSDRAAGVYRSRDGGHSWEALSSAPFFGSAVFGLAVHPADSAHVLAATGNGLYASRDGGAGWQRLPSIPLNLEGIIDPDSSAHQMREPVLFDVAFDPFDPSTVYVASMPGGVWISRDGGQSWAQAMAGMDPNEPVYEILPDPARPGLLYASSGLSGVFYSTDGGHIWQQLSDGLTNTSVRGLALSPDGSVLYAGTVGSGVFRLGTP